MNCQTSGLLVLLCLSLFGSQAQHEVSIYPNPFAEEVNFVASPQCGDSLSFEVYDVMGRKLLTSEKHGIKLPDTLSYELEIDEGTYIVRFLFTSHEYFKKWFHSESRGSTKVNLVLSPQCPGQPFEIYPNPSLSGKISVRQLNTDLPYQVHIFDASGKKVWYQSLKNRKTAVERIDLSTEPDGLYFVRIISAQGTAVKKVSLLQEN